MNILNSQIQGAQQNPRGKNIKRITQKHIKQIAETKM